MSEIGKNSIQETVKGRILTRHHSGNALLYYVKTIDGPVKVVVNDSARVCFCLAHEAPRLSAIASVRIEELGLSSFSHQSVSAIYSQTGQAFRQLVRQANDLGVELFEADIRPEQRYLIERFIALDAEFIGQAASARALPTFTASRARKRDLKITMSIVSLDFECAMDGQLYSVALYGESDTGEKIAKVIMVGDSPQSQSVDYIDWVEDEASLIHGLVAWFKQADPDIIIGWAVVTFDIALLYRRAKYHNIALTLGRGDELLNWKVEDKYRPETLILPGRVVLDGIDWLKAAFYQFDSFSLEHVSRQLLGEGKAIDKVENRGESITELFQHDKLALAHYNLTDSRLVWDIFKKTHLTEFAMERSRLTGLELGRVGGSVAAFNNLYLPYLHRAGFVAPSRPASDGIESPGGYVMDSVPGLYQHILVLDFKSLYPSIIRTFNIDPKALIEGERLAESQTVPGFLGATFNRQGAILPNLIAELSAKRELAKLENNAPLSQAIKIIMNSLYGVLGSRGCVFHDARLASSITLRGHQIMKQTRQWIEELGLRVIYGDTDSTFVHLADLSGIESIDKFAENLVAIINGKWQARLAELYNIPCYLELEYERHFEQFFMPTLRGSTEGSKKRYVGAYTNPKGELSVVFKGMEQVRSDWSPLARQVQEQLYYRLFAKQDVQEYLQDIIVRLQAGELDELLIFSKRLRRDIADYTQKASPHVKAASLYCERSGVPAHGKRGSKIEYLITLSGAEPIQFCIGKIDYQYYLDKQIAPISDPVLSVFNVSFSDLISKQMTLI
ncbi:DNA polymerase II [Shewanella colwelliana]|uniref:DNA polymerase II n=1 Tax=Shewanella colwelliana TaxID=23 RepID=UPI00299E7C39|nr:DNA polymerase II [Shewanella colwelliana]MDX1281276.1 DNA polymerase II [Shewanella colwelliana]